MDSILVLIRAKLDEFEDSLLERLEQVLRILDAGEMDGAKIAIQHIIDELNESESGE